MHNWLTEAGLRVRVDVLVFTPLHHAFQDGHQTFKAFLSQGQFLRTPHGIINNHIRTQNRTTQKLIHLQGRRAELMAGATLCDLREVVDQALEYVGGVQITVVVDVDVHHTLGIWGQATRDTDGV